MARVAPASGWWIMTPEEVARHFNAKPAGPGRWNTRCSAHHPDKNPSLDIGTGDDGRALVICRAGCPTSEVLRAAGLSFRDLFPDRDQFIADPGLEARRREQRTLKTWADELGKKLAKELLSRNRFLTAGEKLLARDPDNQLGWQFLQVAYRGTSELEWIADLLASRDPSDWETARGLLL